MVRGRPTAVELKDGRFGLCRRHRPLESSHETEGGTLLPKAARTSAQAISILIEDVDRGA